MSSTPRDDAPPGGRHSDLERFSASLTRPARGEPADLVDPGPEWSRPFRPAEPGADDDSFGARGDDGPRGGRAPMSGFATIVDQLDRRSRESVEMVRLLEQNRQALDAAEAERPAVYAELARIVPVVQDAAKRLAAELEAARDGAATRDLGALFARSGEALAQLEKTAVALSAHFLRSRTAWEQYVRSVESAERLRNEGGGA